MNDRPRASLWGRCIFVIALLLAGLPLMIGGGKLWSLGGSPYYALAGAALLVTAFLIGKSRGEGAWLYTVTLAATLCWALWEVGPDPCQLLPRLGGPLGLGVWLAMPWPRRGLLYPSGSGSPEAGWWGTGGLLALWPGWRPFSVPCRRCRSG